MTRCAELAVKVQRCNFGAASRLTLPREDEAHVWHTPTNPSGIEISRLQSILSEDEKRRAGRLRFEKNRNEFIISHGMLRLLIASYLNIASQQVCFTYDLHCKPSLEVRVGVPALAFNLSHTDGLAICAFAQHRRIGIDAEKVRTDFNVEEIAERFFSLAERQVLRTLPAGERYSAFFRCWTRKEAYIKAHGEGLSHPLHQFDVCMAEDSAALLATRPDAAEASRWWLQAITVPAGYVAALAVEVTGNINSSDAALEPHGESSV